MKDRRFFKYAYLLFLCLPIMSGCAFPVLKMPEKPPAIVKAYKHMLIHGNNPSMVDTGVRLDHRDTFTVLATGNIDFCPRWSCGYHHVTPDLWWPLMLRIDDTPFLRPFYRRKGATLSANGSGSIHLGIRKGKVDRYGNPLNRSFYRWNRGFFRVDIIVFPLFRFPARHLTQDPTITPQKHPGTVIPQDEWPELKIAKGI